MHVVWLCCKLAMNLCDYAACVNYAYCVTVFQTCNELVWCWYTLHEQVNPTGKRRECLQGSTGNGNSSVNLPPQEYCTGVFIGTRVPAVHRQGCLCPREPRVSSEYSHKGRLQTVITEKSITDEARNTLIPVGPVIVGRIPHGLPNTMRT
jgi:hypothetical protein